MHKKAFELLKKEAKKRDSLLELDATRPDPLLVAKKYNDEYISLVCALFSYGNAKAIVKFLKSLDFTLFDKDEEEITVSLSKKKYRFQSSKDIVEIFKTIKRLKSSQNTLEEVFLKGYRKDFEVMEGLESLLEFIGSLNDYDSYGYRFFFGKAPSTCKASTFKRWHMFLRWMVRKDNLDMGLWKAVHSKDLLIPLDIHTFKIAQRLGLLKRKSYDFKAVLELTETLKNLEPQDPIKYDFALYRIGQEKIL